MAILVITCKLDFTADNIIKNLESKGQKVYRLNTEDLCTTHDIEIHLSNDGHDGIINSIFREIKISEIGSVYYRKPSLRKTYSQDPVVDKFVRDEIDFFLKWLWTLLRDKFWVSHYSSLRLADSKLDQLRIAPILGFRIPKTIITNKPKVAMDFLDDCGGEMINKVLHSVVLERDSQFFNIFCHSVKREDLRDENSIRMVPCVFQEKIDKNVELRITVVGNHVFSCEIHSQKSAKTKDDWRNYDFENTPHLKHNLPTTVENQCRALLRYYDLAYGAIDMILTPKGEYVFLEINPNGQYLWIEQLTELPITDAIADMLIAGRII